MKSTEFKLKKPKTRRGTKALEERAPKIHENPKSLSCIRGNTTSDVVNKCLTDLNKIHQPDSIKYQKKNEVLPFQDTEPLEKLCQKHSKKRPHNLILGRMYSSQVLDMVELGISEFASMQDFKTEKPGLGHKPMIVFKGDAFDVDPDLQHMRNLLLDMFRGPEVPKVNLAGLDHAIVITAHGDKKLSWRSYFVQLKKSGSRKPRVELVECGPRMDWEVRRTQWASADVRKAATKKPKEAKLQLKKNIELDSIGHQYGRVHMTRQDVDSMALRKYKGLRKRPTGGDGEQRAKSGKKRQKR